MRKRILAALASLAVVGAGLFSPAAPSQASVPISAPVVKPVGLPRAKPMVTSYERKVIAARSAAKRAGQLKADPNAVVKPVPIDRTMFAKVQAERKERSALRSGNCPNIPSACYAYGRGVKVMTGATVVAAIVSQHKPYITSTPGEHSLLELNVSKEPAGHSIEHMWTVDVGLNGDNLPHLANYFWISGVPYCYNGSCGGYTDNPTESVDVGDAVAYTAAGAAPTNFYQYRVERYTTPPTWCPTCGSGWRTAWQIGGVDHIMGVFPDSTMWTPGGGYTSANEAQEYFEVADPADDYTCSDMGGGAFGVGTNPSSSAEVKAFSQNGTATGTGTGSNFDVVEITEQNSPTPTVYEPKAFRAWWDPLDHKRFRASGPGFTPTSTSASNATGTIGTC